MDLPNRERPLPQGSPRRSPKAMRPGAATEADENASAKRPVAAWAASPQRKKVLGERNDGGGGGGVEAAASPPPAQLKPAPSPPTLTGRGAGAYDPKTNYTTPRPEFLRYDPERRREILLRVARAAEVDDCSSSSSGAGASEDDGGSVTSDAEAASSVSSAPRSDSEAELDDSDDDEEEDMTQPRRGRWARRLFLLLVAVACWFCYMHCMNPAAFHVPSEDGVDFIGPIGGMYDGDHVDSLRLLGQVYMMGPEDVLEETTNQLVQGETGGAEHRDDQRASRNLVAVMMLGLADMCPNVQLGELCPIWGESSESAVDSKEDSELDEHKTEESIESSNKNEQSCEVGRLDGISSLDSTGASSAHSADMEEDNSGLVHQEEGEDHPNQFVMPLVLEKATESSSDKPSDRYLESVDAELWQYENTAEAAKEICSAVKFLWSAMKPHFLQILSCLSVAGFVAAMFRYFQRSREMVVPARPHMLSKPPAEVPVLVPNQIVQLPVYSSDQPTQLTVPRQGLSGSLEVPMELPLPKVSDPFGSLNVPVQEPLPNTDPSVSVKVTVDHGKQDQKHQQQQDANNTEASNSKYLNHRNVDSSKPPVVELLGEFTFSNSTRGRAIKSLNQYAGDAAVQELPEKDVDKMQMNSSMYQMPTFRRGREEQGNSVKGEKMDVTPAPLTPTPLTPTSLRRSNRLRNKVMTSP